MHDALLIDRLQFAFTITFHYLFPQLTMGLSLLIVILLILGFCITDGVRLTLSGEENSCLPFNGHLDRAVFISYIVGCHFVHLCVVE